MYKTLGAYTWIGMFKEPEPYAECSATEKPPISFSADDTEQSIAKSAQEFSLALNNLKTVKKNAMKYFFILQCLAFRCFLWKFLEVYWVFQHGGAVFCTSLPLRLD